MSQKNQGHVRRSGATGGHRVAGAHTTTARRLTPEQKRRILARRRQLRRRKQLTIAIPAVLVLALVVVLGLTLSSSKDRGAAASHTLDINAASVESTVSVEPTATPGPTPEPTQDPNAYIPEDGVFVFDDAYVAAAQGMNTGPLISADLSNVDPAKLERWGTAKEGYLPVLYQAKTSENIIAITVDDCNQASNLRQIVQCALDNGGKLTIFPIGKNLANDKIGSVVKWAWENGMEIENHTYTHAGMYHYDDERMTNEMWAQNAQLSQLLGVNYQEHFFRPKGGDERNDQRVHAYARQMGMKGIAIWTQSGSSTPVSKLNLVPGAIFLFHTTDKDLSRLLELIPLATRSGFRLVTLNEMFGLPDNEVSDISTIGEKPALEPFHIILAELKKTSYIRAAAVVQKRLIELGWLKGDADGVFGKSSYMATGYFQRAGGIKADGVAGSTTQRLLFSDDAPKK